MKVYSFTKDKGYFKIGDSPDTKDWFEKTPEVAEICNSLEVGDEVTITWREENKKKFLTDVIIDKKTEIKTEIPTDNRFRTPEQIRKDETMKSACEAIKTMTGQFADINVLGENVCILFDKLYGKIK